MRFRTGMAGSGAIDEVRVGHLAGSSGTSVGFNAAIGRIKAEASR